MSLQSLYGRCYAKLFSIISGSPNPDHSSDISTDTSDGSESSLDTFNEYSTDDSFKESTNENSTDASDESSVEYSEGELAELEEYIKRLEDNISTQTAGGRLCLATVLGKDYEEQSEDFFEEASDEESEEISGEYVSEESTSEEVDSTSEEEEEEDSESEEVDSEFGSEGTPYLEKIKLDI